MPNSRTVSPSRHRRRFVERAMTQDVDRKGQKPKDKSERKKSSKAPSPEPLPETKKRKTYRDEIYQAAVESPPTSPENDPDALDRFRLSEGVKSLLLAKGISSLFPIQAQTFDLVLDGFDVVGRAKTGSGKTLAFVLPIMERLMKEDADRPMGRGPSVLCLTPTRELAKQVRCVRRVRVIHEGIRSKRNALTLAKRAVSPPAVSMEAIHTMNRNVPCAEGSIFWWERQVESKITSIEEIWISQT